MIIRTETPADHATITNVNIAAFANHPVSRQTEHFIVSALRKASALSLSIVAVIDDEIVGHAAFSPVEISSGCPNWYGLGPIAVLPHLQRQGLGKALMKHGLDMIKQMGALGCALVGDPNYYTRFGFKSYPQLVHEGIPQEFFMALPFGPDVPSGIIQFHPGFAAESF